MNITNFQHAFYAVLMMVPFALLGHAWEGAALASGFFIGVEWMQQIRVHVAATGREWPTKLDLYDIFMGFMWDNVDRWGDAGMPVIFCISAAVLWTT